MKVGRKLGSKNSKPMPARYEGGFGAVNFWLAILLRAKIDFDKWHYSKMMVRAFVEWKGIPLDDFLETKGMNVDGLEEAWWVCRYVKDNISEVKDES